MSRTTEEARRIIWETIQTADISGKSLNIEIVDKLPGTLACYSEPRRLITFNRRHVTRAREEELIETVLHELAHAYVENTGRFLRQVKLMEKMEKDSVARKYINYVDWGSHKSTKFKHALRLVKVMYQEVKNVPNNTECVG